MILRNYFFINDIEYFRDSGNNYCMMFSVLRRSQYLIDYYYEGEQLGEI